MLLCFVGPSDLKWYFHTSTILIYISNFKYKRTYMYSTYGLHIITYFLNLFFLNHSWTYFQLFCLNSLCVQQQRMFTHIVLMKYKVAYVCIHSTRVFIFPFSFELLRVIHTYIRKHMHICGKYMFFSLKILLECCLNVCYLGVCIGHEKLFGNIQYTCRMSQSCLQGFLPSQSLQLPLVALQLLHETCSDIWERKFLKFESKFTSTFKLINILTYIYAYLCTKYTLMIVLA